MQRAKTLDEYRKHESHRQMIISFNRARRIMGLPLLADVPKLLKPQRPMLCDKHGTYIGCGDVGQSIEDAIEQAVEMGEAPHRMYCKMVDAL